MVLSYRGCRFVGAEWSERDAAWRYQEGIQYELSWGTKSTHGWRCPTRCPGFASHRPRQPQT